ncbi:LysR family transcriptional regulator [Celerinatantimonas diazotrophica]|uniref:LysR family transcriptional regulator n=1 Tax=Celerinatantimonas diazotrophica TaxID=412034 RepID=A0A4R1J7Z5_9GAMM|nr:LysR family transcriptional regulator [Celerinatantimonas diazotrophica]TCK46424.1 LysR family transcriptional regulator [Celerinatantimonas diazotrophica]CAG9295199.1 HTH-type transcriptional regulator TrpI [Celerinatantimonas diazotrophica]
MSLPSLKALHYFTVAAKTGSFVQAGESLHVTHGAVSRQIALLENQLGIQLFERRNRAVFLTEQGQQLAQTCHSVFSQLEKQLEQLTAEQQAQSLVVSCEPTIAMKWLIPRLGDFKEKYPQINVQLVASGGPIDWRQSGAMLALRRNDFQWPTHLYQHKLCDEYMGPVSSPKLSMTAPDTILLDTATRPNAWAEWQQLSGQHLKFEHKSYEHFYLSVQAAVAALGVAMASFLMVQDELANSQLDAPYGFAKDNSAYYLLSEQSFCGNRAIFCQWLSEQINLSLKGVG